MGLLQFSHVGLILQKLHLIASLLLGAIQGAGDTYKALWHQALLFEGSSASNGFC